MEPFRLECSLAVARGAADHQHGAPLGEVLDDPVAPLPAVLRGVEVDVEVIVDPVFPTGNTRYGTVTTPASNALLRAGRIASPASGNTTRASTPVATMPWMSEMAFWVSP